MILSKDLRLMSLNAGWPLQNEIVNMHNINMIKPGISTNNSVVKMYNISNF